MQAANKAHFDAESAGYDKKWAPIMRVVEGAAARIAAAGDLAGKTCLDLGCGTGLVSERLAPKAGMVYGLDVSPGMVEQFNAKAAAGTALAGRMRAAAAAPTDAAAVAAAQAAGDAPADGSVQVAWANMLLHHVDDCVALFVAAARLLAPGALVFVTDVLKTDDSHLFHSGAAHHTVGHVGGFSEEQLRGAILAPAGLRLTSFDPRAFEFEREVDGPEGGKRAMAFPLFFAAAVKEL